jgi:hypothetical protein
MIGIGPAGNRNQDLWQAIPNADTLSLIDDASVWFMVTAEADGTLGLWVASEELSTVTVPDLKVPYFDPSVYCVLAFIECINTTNTATGVIGAATVGNGGIETTAAADFATYHIVIGPVFPHPDNMPVN